jgi:hypothetical protein
MEIRPTARKHHVADEDIEHATRNTIGPMKYQDDGARLYFGPCRSGALLELVKVVRDGSEFVIHAKSIRPEYERLLLGCRAPR